MIFDPHTGSGSTLVCVSTDDSTWTRPDYEAERQQYEQDKREREYRPLMYQRTGPCG